MIAGFGTAWPVNTWLIRSGIKERCSLAMVGAGAQKRRITLGPGLRPGQSRRRSSPRTWNARPD